jgi:hypothetical protein
LERVKESRQNQPVNKNTSTRIESILYELVAGGKMFEQIFIIHVIDLHNLVRVVGKQTLVQR